MLDIKLYIVNCHLRRDNSHVILCLVLCDKSKKKNILECV